MSKNFLNELCQKYHWTMEMILESHYRLACIVKGDCNALVNDIELQIAENELKGV